VIQKLAFAVLTSLWGALCVMDGMHWLLATMVSVLAFLSYIAGFEDGERQQQKEVVR
jgi:hypothetical protein